MEIPDKEDNIEQPDNGDRSEDITGTPQEHPISEDQAAPEPNSNEEKGHALPEVNDNNEAELKGYVRNKTFIGLTVLILGLLAFILAFSWVIHQPKTPDPQEGVYAPLRKVLGFNQRVNSLLFSAKHLTPTYPKSAAVKEARVNGGYGMDTSFKVNDWLLNVVNIDKHDTMTFSMDDIKKLPKTEIVYNFKCIEGWCQITHWGGARVIDFINQYKLATHSGKPLDPNNPKDMAGYMGLQTPDGEYYVGLDMKSAIHPQTLLCYELNGKPLPYDQGAPLRLIIPIKYGIKSLKRIGIIFFSDKRPADYWYERGYDYDAAL